MNVMLFNFMSQKVGAVFLIAEQLFSMFIGGPVNVMSDL